MNRSIERNPKCPHMKMFQVQRKMYRAGADGLEQVEVEGLSPFFGSRFAAVKALRKIRKKHPTAALKKSVMPFSAEATDLSDRAIFKRLIIRAGERR